MTEHDIELDRYALEALAELLARIEHHCFPVMTVEVSTADYPIRAIAWNDDRTEALELLQEIDEDQQLAYSVTLYAKNPTPAPPLQGKGITH